MRLVQSCALSLVLLAPAALLAGFDVQCVESSGTAAPLSLGAEASKSLLEKVDRGAPNLLLPLFEVDTNNAAGTTTLFAVRNISNSAVDVRITYFNTVGDQQGLSNLTTLSSKRTMTINVRDVSAAFDVDVDGFTRGFAIIEDDNQIIANAAIGNDDSQADGKGIIILPNFNRVLAGDFFQVSPDQDFASGDRLLNLNPGDRDYIDLCDAAETRFLNGGAFTGGSDFVFFVFPGGLRGIPFPVPSFTATIYNEAGNIVGTCSVFTDQFSLKIPVSQFTNTPFGTVEFDFNSLGGQVLTEFNASGRFSVGMRGLCKDDSPIF
jgi:hypothetical protein